MKLEFIPLDKLAVSKANMRYAKKAPDVSDILPTVRARGVIQSLVVRPAAQPGHYEILAGARRYHAALIISAEASSGAEGVGEESGDAMLLPCAILDAGDDAAAVKASLIENLARLDPDEVNQWVNFVRLVKEGRSIADIAATFGLPELTVRRVLALGNLLPRIRNLYGAQEIDRVTVRHLTFASKSQQRDWLNLHDDPDARAPTGHQLKAWLLGGQAIATRHALFDLAGFDGAIVSHLFGEDSYFATPEQFWAAQQAEVEARKAAYLDAGWQEVVIVPPSQYFHAWEHEKVAKRKGGRVYIELRASGEVCFHEGYMSRKEAARIDRADAVGTRPVRPEITARMQAYVDLHRHAAVRAALVGHPQIALRLMVAHAICGSPLSRVTPDPRTARDHLVAESVENAIGEADFDHARRRVLDLLGFSSEETHVTGGNARDQGVSGLFLHLLTLPDEAMLDIVTIVMGETLASGSDALEAVGNHIGVDMADYWMADDAFFEQLRDRDILTALVAEVVDLQTATANAGARGNVLQEIIRDGLDDTNGREKRDRWVPRLMAFPPSAYSARGAVGTVETHQRVEVTRAQLVQASQPDMDGKRLAA